MCLIIAQKAGAPPVSDEWLRQAWWRNSDGAGMAYVRDGALQLFKPYGDMIAFMRAYRKAHRKWGGQSPMLLHFRIATHGSKTAINTHPHVTGGGRAALAHNGIIDIDIPKGQDVSDTVVFCRTVTDDMQAEILTDGSVRAEIEKAIGGSNKLAIIDVTGALCIYNEAGGVWSDDKTTWFSNYSYRPYQSQPVAPACGAGWYSRTRPYSREMINAAIEEWERQNDPDGRLILPRDYDDPMEMYDNPADRPFCPPKTAPRSAASVDVPMLPKRVRCAHCEAWYDRHDKPRSWLCEDHQNSRVCSTCNKRFMSKFVQEHGHEYWGPEWCDSCRSVRDDAALKAKSAQPPAPPPIKVKSESPRIWYQCRACLASFCPQLMSKDATANGLPLRRDLCLFCQVGDAAGKPKPEVIDGRLLSHVRICDGCGVLHWPAHKAEPDRLLYCPRCSDHLARGTQLYVINDGLLKRRRNMRNRRTDTTAAAPIVLQLPAPQAAADAAETEEAKPETPPKMLPPVKVIDMVMCDKCRNLFDPEKGGIDFTYVRKCDDCWRVFTCVRCRTALSRKQVIISEGRHYCGNCLCAVAMKDGDEPKPAPSTTATNTHTNHDLEVRD